MHAYLKFLRVYLLIRSVRCTCKRGSWVL